MFTTSNVLVPVIPSCYDIFDGRTTHAGPDPVKVAVVLVMLAASLYAAVELVKYFRRSTHKKGLMFEGLVGISPVLFAVMLFLWFRGRSDGSCPSWLRLPQILFPAPCLAAVIALIPSERFRRFKRAIIVALAAALPLALTVTVGILCRY